MLAWGANANGALGDGKGEAYEVGMNQFSYTPVEVLLPENTTSVQLSSGQRFVSISTSEGALYGWGSKPLGTDGQLRGRFQPHIRTYAHYDGCPHPPQAG